MDLFVKNEVNAKDILEQNLHSYIEKNFVICSDKCFQKFNNPRFNVNDQRCMVNCFNLRNHFWFETHMALNEYLKLKEESNK